MQEYMPIQTGLFTDVDKSLAIVPYYLAVSKAEAAMVSANIQMNAATTALSMTGTTVRDEVYHWATTAVAEIVKAEDRPALLLSAFERYRAAKSRGASDDILRSIALEVLPLFSSLDEKAYMAAAEATGILSEGPLTKNAVATARATLSKANAEYKKTREGYKTGVFTPQGVVSLAASPDPADAAYARSRQFVETWKTRAKHHHVPITVEGRAISSLPDTDGLRKRWFTAYNNLFAGLVKSPHTYLARNYQE